MTKSIFAFTTIATIPILKNNCGTTFFCHKLLKRSVSFWVSNAIWFCSDQKESDENACFVLLRLFLKNVVKIFSYFVKNTVSQDELHCT